MQHPTYSLPCIQTRCRVVTLRKPLVHCEQWRRSVTLVDINRLLEDVQTLN